MIIPNYQKLFTVRISAKHKIGEKKHMKLKQVVIGPFLYSEPQSQNDKAQK